VASLLPARVALFSDDNRSPGTGHEVSNNHFTIRTSQPNVKVSWRLTGVRQDPRANAHSIPNEVDEPADQRGLYLHPELFGTPADKSIVARLYQLVPHPHWTQALQKPVLPQPSPPRRSQRRWQVHGSYQNLPRRSCLNCKRLRYRS